MTVQAENGNQQVMTHVIAQAAMELAKAAVQVVRVTAGPTKRSRAVFTCSASPRINMPVSKQPTFNWKVVDKYSDIMNLQM